jgi:hypothetical protein
MIVEITDEEREFIERFCRRAKTLSSLNVPVGANDDLEKIDSILEKLRNDK